MLTLCKPPLVTADALRAHIEMLSFDPGHPAEAERES